MNAQELKLLRHIELNKYFTLKGSKVTLSSIAEYVNFKNNNGNDLVLDLPEGDLIVRIKNYRVNLKRPNGAGKCSIIMDWGRDDEGNYAPDGGMKPSKIYTIGMGSTLKKLYVFHSNEFRGLTNQAELIENLEDTLVAGTFWKHSYSVLIQTPQEYGHFEAFMSMKYGEPILTGGGDPVYDITYYPYSIEAYESYTWKYFFNKAVGEAVKNHDFNNFLKYDSRIWAEELSLDNRVEILKYLATEEYWGVLDFDGLNEAQFFLELVTTVKEGHKVALYEAIFANGAELYRSCITKLNGYSNEKLKVITFLLNCFYDKISSPEDLDNYLTQIENLPENRIIPILSWKLANSPHSVGSLILKEYLSTGVKINSIKINIRAEQSPIGVFQEPYLLTDKSSLDGSIFSYETILGGFACLTLENAGFALGRIYPFPAFALFEINSIFSEKYSFQQLLSSMINAISLILPFFRIVQGISVGANLRSLGLTITGTFINDSGLYTRIMNDPDGKGKAFLYAYTFVTTIYGVKDVADSYKMYRLMDIDGLMGAYQLFQDTQTYIDIMNLPNDDEEKIQFLLMIGKINQLEN